MSWWWWLASWAGGYIQTINFSERHITQIISPCISFPKNPDPSKMASFWGPKNIPAIQVQTLPLESPCKFLRWLQTKISNISTQQHVILLLLLHLLMVGCCIGCSLCLSLLSGDLLLHVRIHRRVHHGTVHRLGWWRVACGNPAWHGGCTGWIVKKMINNPWGPMVMYGACTFI